MNNDLLLLRKQARRRLIGAVVLVCFALIVLWTTVDTEPPPSLMKQNRAVTLIVTPPEAPVSSAAPPPPLPDPPAGGVSASAPDASQPSPPSQQAPAQRESPLSRRSHKESLRHLPGTETAKKRSPTASTQRYLQLAAYYDPKKASLLLEKARQLGIPAYIQRTTTVNGDLLIRVRVGPADNAQLKTWKERLHSVGVRSQIVNQ